MSLPTYAVTSSATPRRSASSRRTGSLSSMPWRQSTWSLRARTAAIATGSVDRITASTPTSRRRLSPKPSARQQQTLSSPRSFTQTRLSVKTPSKSKTASLIRASSASVNAGGRDGLLDRLEVLEGDAFLERQGLLQALAEQPLELVGRKTAVRRGLGLEIARREDVPGRELARRDELLPHLAKGVLLDGQAALDRVAE